MIIHAAFLKTLLYCFIEPPLSAVLFWSPCAKEAVGAAAAEGL